LAFCSKITDTSVTALAEHCPRLTQIDLKYCSKITDVGLNALVEGCDGLTSINFCGLPMITKTGVIALANHYRGLGEIRDGIAHISPDVHTNPIRIKGRIVMKPYRTRGTSFNDKEILDYLNLVVKHLWDAYLKYMIVHGIIEYKDFCLLHRYCYSLDLSYSEITDETLVWISQSYCLRYCIRSFGINLDGCVGITDEGVCALVKGCPLKKISLVGCNITDASVIALVENCEGLTRINLGSCPNITDASVIALADNCPGLRAIGLYGCTLITDASVMALAEHCHGLTTILLSGCSRITDGSIKNLATSCKRLVSIGFVGCLKITDESITEIIRLCKCVREIYCQDTAVTKKGRLMVLEHDMRIQYKKIEE